MPEDNSRDKSTLSFLQPKELKPEPETELQHSSAEVNDDITCSTCQACCCRLEVMIISDTGVPDKHIARDEWGSETMLRLEDGFCSALDRETSMCTIYENRPWICRDFEMGSHECEVERAIPVVYVD